MNPSRSLRKIFFDVRTLLNLVQENIEFLALLLACSKLFMYIVPVFPCTWAEYRGIAEIFVGGLQQVTFKYVCKWSCIGTDAKLKKFQGGRGPPSSFRLVVESHNSHFSVQLYISRQMYFSTKRPWLPNCRTRFWLLSFKNSLHFLSFIPHFPSEYHTSYNEARLSQSNI